MVRDLYPELKKLFCGLESIEKHNTTVRIARHNTKRYVVLVFDKIPISDAWKIIIDNIGVPQSSTAINNNAIFLYYDTKYQTYPACWRVNFYIRTWTRGFEVFVRCQNGEEKDKIVEMISEMLKGVVELRFTTEAKVS